LIVKVTNSPDTILRSSTATIKFYLRTFSTLWSFVTLVVLFMLV